MAKIKLNEKSKIRVISNVHGSLGTYCNLTDKRYFFQQKNSAKDITLEELESMYNDKPNLIDDGYIKLNDVEIYEYLNVPKEIYENILPDKAIEEILVKEDAKTLKEKMKKMPKQVKENVALKARELEIDSLNKIEVIKEETGLDVNPRRDENFDE